MGYIIDFVALALLYVFVFLRKWKGRGTLFVNTLMYICLSFVLYFNFEGVSYILRYYIHAYECTISYKFEIRTKKNSRGIYNIYSISSDDHIQF